MDRKEFLGRLMTVAPALASNEVLQAFTHLWFTGSHVMAHDDRIAISTPCKTDFIGAVPQTLIGLLNASKAKTIDITNQKDEIHIKAGGARWKLPLLPLPTIFAMPEPKAKDALPVDTGQFLAAMELCMRSVSTDTSRPDQIGITIIPTPKELKLFSTNSMTVTFARLACKKQPFSERVVLSGVFCEQLLKMAKGAKAIVMEIYDDYSLLSLSDTHLFGRLVHVPQPRDFETMLKHHLPNGYEKQLVDMPPRLSMIIERANIIADIKIGEGHTTIKVTNSKARFETICERSEGIDVLTIEGHKDIELKVNPKLLKGSTELFNKLLFQGNCVVMQKDSTMFLVSVED